MPKEQYQRYHEEKAKGGVGMTMFGGSATVAPDSPSVFGQLGENIATEGIDLLSLSTGAKLFIGDNAVIEITGLRNPCAQIDDFQKGLMKAVLDRGS